MNFKYWQWESHELREKLKKPSVKEIANTLFPSETHAYRFARVLCIVKRKGSVRLREMPSDLPKATWHRYLEAGYEMGFFDKKDDVYVRINRFSNPVKNFGEYYAKWLDSENVSEEGELPVLFPRAQKGKYNQAQGKEGQETVAASEQAAGKPSAP